MQEEKKVWKPTLDVTPAQVFATGLKGTAGIDVEQVKDKELVMLMGPTGSGKSVVLNQATGAKITCQYNDDKGSWEIKADPEYSKVGHNKSCSLEPTFWSSPQGIIYCDNPGFNDTRGLHQQVAKSCFIKTVGENARSMKIIFVTSIESVMAERSGNFGKILKQLKAFIPDLDIKNDTEMIVTKCDSMKKPKHIVNTLRDNLNLSYLEEKVTIINMPCDTADSPYDKLDISKIASRLPSINSKIGLVISNDARVELEAFHDQLADQISVLITVLSKKVVNFYFQFLVANLQEPLGTISDAYLVIKTSQSVLKKCTNERQFIKLLLMQMRKLDGLGNGKCSIKHEEISECLNRKFAIWLYLDSLLKIERDSLSTWLMSVQFPIIQHLKSTGPQSRSLQHLREALRPQGINLDGNIQDDVHKNFVHPYSFTASYSGQTSKTLSIDISQENIPYEGKVFKAGQLDIYQNVHCVQHVKYKGSVTKPHTVQRRYTQGMWWWKSNHSQQIKISTTAHFQGSELAEVNQRYTNKLPYHAEGTYKGSCAHQEFVSEKVTEKYSGTHLVACTDHHKCACDRLGAFLYDYRKNCEDLIYLKTIWEEQQSILESEEPFLYNIESERSSLASQLKSYLKIDVLSFLKGVSQYNIAQSLHEALTTDNKFRADYKTDPSYAFSKEYPREVKYKGKVLVQGTIRHDAVIPFDGIVNYSGYASYSHDDSRFGNLQGTHYYSGNQDFKSVKRFSKNYSYTENIPYEGKVSYIKKIDRSGTIPYNGSHEVCCQKKNQLGQGHHDCRSCKTWAIIISHFRDLLTQRQHWGNAIRVKQERVSRKLAEGMI